MLLQTDVRFLGIIESVISSLISLTVAVAIAQTGQGSFALRDGDRVLFYGDSITDNQFYPQFVENYVLTRFPAMRVSFFNYGWSGDRVTGGGGGDIDKRLNRDVFPFKPSVVTIMLGMNDGLYRPWDEATFRTYSTGYEKILDALKAKGAPRVTLIKPSPYDDVTMTPLYAGGYNSVLLKFGDYLAGIGFKYGARVADFNQPVVDMLTKAKAADAENARRLIPDRVHPTAPVHMVMGDALLKAWNAPSLVSAVAIDGSTGYSKSDNASVRDLKVAANTVTWRVLDGALPVFFDRANPLTALVLKSSDVAGHLNQQPLKVTNLPEGNYRLTIDGEDMGTFTDEQLTFGINLADLPTPMLKQSALVSQWTSRRQFLRQTMWRSIAIPAEDWDLAHRQQAIAGLERLEADVIDKQREAAKPVWRSFKVQPVTRNG